MPSKGTLSMLLVLSVVLLLAATMLPAHAASVLVQQNNMGCLGCSSTLSVSFANNVASGDVIVVGIVVSGASFAVRSVTDSLGSSFTRAITSTSTAPPIVYSYYATLAASGAEVVTATFAAAAPAESIYIYEVSGVTTAGLATSTGSGTGTAISTSSAVSFQTGAFLLGIVGTNSFTGTATAGTGFTLSIGNSGTEGTYAQYSASDIATSTSFQAIINPAVGWVETGIALMPN